MPHIANRPMPFILPNNKPTERQMTRKALKNTLGEFQCSEFADPSVAPVIRQTGFSMTQTARLVARPLSPSTRALEVTGLFASALPNIFAVIFRLTEAGTNAFMMRFSRPGTILERFSRRALRPSDTHCSTLICFSGMVFGSMPIFASTGEFVGPGGTTVT